MWDAVPFGVFQPKQEADVAEQKGIIEGLKEAVDERLMRTGYRPGGTARSAALDAIDKWAEGFEIMRVRESKFDGMISLITERATYFGNYPDLPHGFAFMPKPEPEPVTIDGDTADAIAAILKDLPDSTEGRRLADKLKR